MIDCQCGNDSTIVGAGVDSVKFASRDLDLHARLLGSLLNFLELTRPLFGPTLHHNLLFRVELDSVTSLGVHIAEEAFLPTREGKEGYWRRYADVDADVASLRLVSELAGRCPTAREQARHVAVGGGVHELNRLINRLSLHQAEYRPEDLDPGQLTARLDVVQHRRAHEVAPLVARDRRVAPVDEDPGSFVDAFADQRLDALLALRSDDRSHLDPRIEPVADLARLGHVGDPLSEFAARLTDRDGHRGGQAALSGAAKGRVGDDTSGHLHIGIWQDHDRVFGATRALGTLAIGSSSTVDVLCYR